MYLRLGDQQKTEPKKYKNAHSPIAAISRGVEIES